MWNYQGILLKIRVWFRRSGVRPENPHSSEAPIKCWCYWFLDHSLEGQGSRRWPSVRSRCHLMQKWLPAGWRRDVVLQKKAKRRNAHWFLDHLTQRSSRFLAPGTHLWKNMFLQRVQGGDGSGGNTSDGESWGTADEASLTCPPHTSCSAAWFLTGHGESTGSTAWGFGIPGNPCISQPSLSWEMFPNNKPSNAQQNTFNAFPHTHPGMCKSCYWKKENSTGDLALPFRGLLWELCSLV